MAHTCETGHSSSLPLEDSKDNIHKILSPDPTASNTNLPGANSSKPPTPIGVQDDCNNEEINNRQSYTDTSFQDGSASSIMFPLNSSFLPLATPVVGGGHRSSSNPFQIPISNDPHGYYAGGKFTFPVLLVVVYLYL